MSGRRDDDVAASVERLRVDGYCVLEQLLSTAVCKSLVAQLERRYAEGSDHHLVASRVALFQGAINYCPEIAEFLADSRVTDVAEQLLASPVRTSFTTAIINDCGADDGALHADWPYDYGHVAHLSVPYPDVPLHVTTLWALTPPDDDAGGTIVIPESHRLPFNPTFPDCVHAAASSAPKLVSLSEGSVLVLDSRVWHARKRNTGQSPRLLFAAGYVPWWLNLEPLRPGAPRVRGLHPDGVKNDFRVPLIKRDIYAQFSERAQSFFEHSVDSE